MSSLLRAVAAAPPAMPASMLRSTLAGRYSIERLLGEGGMGAVYLAREVELDRLVALKVIRSDLAADPEFRERLKDEARIAAGLSHPNVVPVHRFDDVNGVLLMVMGFVDGQSLRQRMRESRFKTREVMAVLRDVAWALAHAHAAGVVHRDIKPDNILVERSSGRVVVADFGIAARGGNEDTAGTHAYMSPEQAAGGDVDGRSDLYSLGVMAWEMFTGEIPRLPINAPLLGVPPAVGELVERLVSADPAMRPRSASELADALTTLIEGARIPPDLRVWAEGDRSVDLGFAVILVPCAFVALVFQGAALLTPALALVYPAFRRMIRVRALLRSGHRTEDLCAALTARLEEGQSSELPSARVPRAIHLLRSGRFAGAALLAGTLPVVGLLAASEDGATGRTLNAVIILMLGALCGFLLLGAASVALGLAAPAQSLPWREQLALHARRWLWSTRAAGAFASLVRGESDDVPAGAHVEGRLAAATSVILRRSQRNHAHGQRSLTAVVQELESIAARARAAVAQGRGRSHHDGDGDDDGDGERLTRAVMHLERIKLAVETADVADAHHQRAAANAVDACEGDARAFINGSEAPR